MFSSLTEVAPFLVPVVTMIAVFTFAAIAAYSGDRRKEREAFYRYELQKKLAESSGVNSEQILELFRTEQGAQLQERREGLKVGGLITAAVGVGMLIGFRFIGDDIWMLGYIPLFIGAAMFLYALFFSPRPPARDARPGPPPA